MTSLNELFEIIRTLLGRRLPHLKNVRAVHREPRRGDILLSRADIGKARRLLGYEPTRCASWTGWKAPWTGTSRTSRRAETSKVANV